MKTPTNQISPVQTTFFILMMCFVVVISNYLLQFPVQGTLAGINLADLLTWGAFSYPLAFFVTDLTNRQFGPKAARIVVFSGFVLGVALSIYLATPRIAVASGCAFLIAQFLDISIFNRLRQSTWWKAPFISSFLGSVIDTAIFFSLAFAAMFVFLGANDDFALGSSKLLGVYSTEFPRWVSWAIGDFCVKILVGLIMLVPYGGIVFSLRRKHYS